MKGISSKEPSGVLLDAPTQGPPRDFGNSVDHEKSVRPFKGIFCRDISEFESYMPSQAVRSLSASGMKGSQSIWAFEPPAERRPGRRAPCAAASRWSA